ncbi:BTB/POZ protein [Rhizophagus irregularis DAOM 181602=DAOM 197198]|nr:BTB/POZ protein [Rhizophagus irregularis DAOM 181602=DAOM 197198]
MAHKFCRLPNISPEIFQIILEYIYGGIISLSGQDTSDILDVLLAANELCFQELVDYLQKYLIENKSEWMKENFEFTQRISSQSNNLVDLQHFCTDFVAKFPERILKSLYFTSLSEKLLISLIKRDNLQMKEVEIWEHVLKWGLAQNPTLVSDPNDWSDNDFKTMENTLQYCLPFVRLFSLSSKEFSDKVRPYQKLFKRQSYEDLLNSYLDPYYEPSDIKDSEEILGGYNPITWMNVNSWGEAQNCFIFSFKNRSNFKDAILSIVKYTDNALNYHPDHGPFFGNDLIIYTSEESKDSADIDFDTTKVCNETSCYEKSIREGGEFLMEDYEIFQIIKR